MPFLPVRILVSSHSIKSYSFKQICSRWHSILSKSFLREHKAWQFMWIVCSADDSYQMSRLTLKKVECKNHSIKISPSAVVICTLRVDSSHIVTTQTINNMIIYIRANSFRVMRCRSQNLISCRKSKISFTAEKDMHDNISKFSYKQTGVINQSLFVESTRDTLFWTVIR